MKIIGKILWVILIGWWLSLAMVMLGIISCVSLIFIPFAPQFFRIARVAFCPQSRIVSTAFGTHPIANVLWFWFFGMEFSFTFAICGIVLCLTIIGIPFGKQFFKLMKISAFPFGAGLG